MYGLFNDTVRIIQKKIKLCLHLIKYYAMKMYVCSISKFGYECIAMAATNEAFQIPWNKQ
jgi:hypothetical protein